ncbi:hypothetical protein GALMADRAFT_799388 [Galerina marginata CBS 339.88]|uniref:Uncharacterized protein n=1 Tax=Galerina marginata (strain CBS 339.88) TaxID=685588 RepID=A0A067SK74_GALM3|nr:hypothetical protein GALMADRAFT_799388 [Galerina marginata CBS 339.88]
MILLAMVGLGGSDITANVSVVSPSTFTFLDPLSPSIVGTSSSLSTPISQDDFPLRRRSSWFGHRSQRPRPFSSRIFFSVINFVQFFAPRHQCQNHLTYFQARACSWSSVVDSQQCHPFVTHQIVERAADYAARIKRLLKSNRYCSSRAGTGTRGTIHR